MPTPEEYKARYQELLAKFDEFYAEIQGLPYVKEAGIGFHDVEERSLESMGFVIHIDKDVDLEAMLVDVEFPETFLDEPVLVRSEPDPIPEGSGTRPIKGGIRCQVVKSSYGTLGGVAKYNPSGKAVLLSNHHVLYGHGKGNGDTVYQPSPSCCNSYAVGKNVLGIDDKVDAAIAEASVNVTNEIEDIGTIIGTAAATCGAMIEKTGAKTGHTKGMITNVVVKPTSRAAITAVGVAGEPAFTQGGDSGSFYVNSSKQVVGLHNSGATIGGIKYSYGAKIEDVVSKMDITIPNPDLDDAADQAEFLIAPPLSQDLSKYEEEASKSVNGRAGLQLGKQYADEVRDLVHHNRAVTVVWLDNKGPQFGEAWQGAETDPTRKLPKTVDGVSLDTLIRNMAQVLSQQGSLGLAKAIQTYQSSVLAAAGQLDSAQDLRDFVNGNQIHCFAVKFFWHLIWDKGTKFYLPAVAKKGLVDHKLGIDIQPFATINIGDIPQVTMFDEPVLGYMKLTLSDTKVSGIDTVSGGQMSCTDNPDGSATMSFGLHFEKLVFSGNYEVSAGGGLGGCAIAGAAAILGGGGLAEELAAGIPGQAGVNQALWYREPLGRSSNGQALIGSYYANQDAIVDLQEEDGGKNPYMQSLMATDVKTTTESVTKATTYYQNHQYGTLSSEESSGSPPMIGSEDHYSSGQLPYAYLIAMARQKVREGKDPDGRFAKLAEDATTFIGTISWYHTEYPGEQPIGGQDGVLQRIANADPKHVEEHVLSLPPMPVRELESGEVVEYLAPKAFDLRRAFDAYHQMVALTSSEAADSSVHGTFQDTGLNVKLQLEVTLAGNMKSDPKAEVSKVSASIGGISIELSSSDGWWPGLFDKVSNWIANNSFFLDILRRQIQHALQSGALNPALSNLLTGAMKKI